MTDRPNKSHGRLSISATMQPRELMQDRPDLVGAWTARIITLFPGAFPGVLGASLTGKALDEGLWQLQPIDLRLYGEGRANPVCGSTFKVFAAFARVSA